MRANESRPPKGAAPECLPALTTVALTVRLRVDLSALPANRGWVTYEGQRQAMRQLDAVLSAPMGAEVVICTGRIHPMLLGDEAFWRTLLARYRVTVEPSDPGLAREWHDALIGVSA